jgi:hypothetical protein
MKTEEKYGGGGGAVGRRGKLSVVVFSDATGDLVAAEVEGLELDLADAQLLRRRVLRRLVLHELLRSDPICAGPCTTTSKSDRIGNPQRQGKSEEDENFTGWGGRVEKRTSSLSMWRRVVLPALLRLRKSILASFCHSPNEASTP